MTDELKKIARYKKMLPRLEVFLQDTPSLLDCLTTFAEENITIAPLIVEAIEEFFQRVVPATLSQMSNLRSSLKDMLPAAKLHELDVKLAEEHPEWRVPTSPSAEWSVTQNRSNPQELNTSMLSSSTESTATRTIPEIPSGSASNPNFEVAEIREDVSVPFTSSFSSDNSSASVFHKDTSSQIISRNCPENAANCLSATSATISTIPASGDVTIPGLEISTLQKVISAHDSTSLQSVSQKIQEKAASAKILNTTIPSTRSIPDSRVVVHQEEALVQECSSLQNVSKNCCENAERSSCTTSTTTCTIPLIPSCSTSDPNSDVPAFREKVTVLDLSSPQNVTGDCQENAANSSCARVAITRKSTLQEESALKRAKIDYTFSDLVEAIATYVEETQPTYLDLGGMGLGIKSVKAILRFLPDSHVIRLNLRGSFLTNRVVDLLPLLAETKIRDLNVSRCRLTKNDILKLIKFLKNLQITELDVGQNSIEDFDLKETQDCISFLKESQLTTLILDVGYFSRVEIISSLQSFLSTSITCLYLTPSEFSSDQFIFLFENLNQSSITDLNIKDIPISSTAMQILSQNLAETKLKELKFDNVDLDDERLKILAEGLVNSKVNHLYLTGSRCTSIDPLFAKIRKTKIETLTLSLNREFCPSEEIPFILKRRVSPLRNSSLVSLNLSHCSLEDQDGELLMETLRSSNVTKLNVSHNCLSALTIRKLAKNIKKIKLTDLDISFNALSRKAFLILGKCLKKSLLTYINVEERGFPDALFEFLVLTEGSALRQLNMNGHDRSFSNSGLYYLSDDQLKQLSHSSVIDLHLCNYTRNAPSLVSTLKFSSVIYLNLSRCQIQDEDAKKLAEVLEETQIRRLNLTGNRIYDRGAEALARAFETSNLLYLNLKENDIMEDGLDYLASKAKGTFVTELGLENKLYDASHAELLESIDAVIWQNKTRVRKIVDIFKQITSGDSNEIAFNLNLDDFDPSDFLQNCLWLYETISEEKRAVNVLLEEKTVSFSREEILEWVHDKFPRQFNDFIVLKIEAGLADHVYILKTAEKMGLTAVVKQLLLNRGAWFMLDETQKILHPFAYSLMLKYNQPICGEVEIGGVEKVIEYFKHAKVEGSGELVASLLAAREEREGVNEGAGPSGVQKVGK